MPARLAIVLASLPLAGGATAAHADVASDALVHAEQDGVGSVRTTRVAARR